MESDDEAFNRYDAQHDASNRIVIRCDETHCGERAVCFIARIRCDELRCEDTGDEPHCKDKTR